MIGIKKVSKRTGDSGIIPVFFCDVDIATEFLSFWCPYCCTVHHHGRGEGHRSPHCIPKTIDGNPLDATGYILQAKKYFIVTKDEEKFVKFAHCNRLHPCQIFRCDNIGSAIADSKANAWRGHLASVILRLDFDGEVVP